MIYIELICKPQGCGKTCDLIMESAKTGIPILTAYDSRYIVDQAIEMGVKIHQPMTVYEYKNFKRNGSILNSKDWKGKLLVDEIDGVLEQLLGTHVEMATCTPDSMKEKGEEKMMNTTMFDVYKDLLNNTNGATFSNGNTINYKVYINIKDVNIIVPNKVVEVTFEDGSKEKSVCREPDVFSLESAISICISKKIMGGSSAYNNAVKRGVKVYENKLKKEAADKAEQERIEKRRAKKQAYNERRAAKREQAEKERQIEIQREAYLQAMDILRSINRDV